MHSRKYGGLGILGRVRCPLSEVGRAIEEPRYAKVHAQLPLDTNHKNLGFFLGTEFKLLILLWLYSKQRGSLIVIHLLLKKTSVTASQEPPDGDARHEQGGRHPCM